MTHVVFRKWKDDGAIIALFPYIVDTQDPWSCLSYMHTGQHGGACTRHITTVTTLAKPSEYASLLKELKNVGYTDIVIKRKLTRHAFDSRCDSLIVRDNKATIKNPKKLLKDIISLDGWDNGDKWGSAMGEAFTIANELDFRGSVPESWQYSKGCLAPNDMRESEDWNYQACINATTQELEHAGNVLMRYTELLRKHGHDY